MKKLEYKKITPYLPYGLQWTLQEMKTYTMSGLTKETIYTEEGQVLNWDLSLSGLPQALFPILKPLSDLFIKRFDDENGGLRHIDIISKEIFFDNHVDDETSHEYFWHGLVNSMIYPTFNQSKELLDFLYENHYDVEALFNNGTGLIEKGLAIDVNKLEG